MKNTHGQNGQTLIETILTVSLTLGLIFGVYSCKRFQEEKNLALLDRFERAEYISGKVIDRKFSAVRKIGLFPSYSDKCSLYVERELSPGKKTNELFQYDGEWAWRIYSENKTNNIIKWKLGFKPNEVVITDIYNSHNAVRTIDGLE